MKIVCHSLMRMLQVLLSFMLSAYTTLVLLVIHYLLDDRRTTNSVDRRFIDLVTRAWNKEGGKSRKWTEAFEGAVIMYSDTQVITGIAVGTLSYFVSSGSMLWSLF